MTRPIVMDVIARDNASKTFKQVAQSQSSLAKSTDGLSKGNDNLRKSQLSLIAAQERYNKVASSGKATAGQLAAAQSSLIGAHQRVRKATDDTTTSTKRFGAVSSLAYTAVGLAAVGFAKGVIQAARDQQKANAQTAAVIKSTGGVANVTAKQVGDLSGSISKLTGIQDDTIQSGANMLLTFTNIRNEVGKGNDIFNQATQVVTDMSVALGQDTKNSAIQLGKALNDPIAGVTALRRVGVTFSTDQMTVIKRLVETGDTLGAQKVILQELTKEFGGSAAAQATAADKAKVAWGEFQEAVGNVLLPILDKLLRTTTSVIEWVGKYAPIIVPLIGVLGGFAAAVWAVNAATRAWAASQLALTTVFGPRFVAGLGGAAAGLGGLAAAIGPAAAAFGVLLIGAKLAVDAVGHGDTMIRSTSSGIKDLGKSLKESGGVFDSNAQHILANTLVQGKFVEKAAKAHITVQDLTAGITGNDEQFQHLIDTWRASGKPSEETIINARRLHEAFLENTAAGKDNAATTKQVTEAAKSMTTVLSAQDEALAQVRTATGDQNLTMADAAKKYTDAVTQAHSFTAELGYMQIALENTSGKFITAKLGQLQLTDAIGTATDNWAASRAQVDAHGQSLKDNTADGRANEEWLLGQINAINQQALTYATSSGSIDKGTGSLKTNTDALRVAAEKAGFNKQEVQHMIDVYGTTPAEIKTSIEEQGSAAVLASLGDILNQLHAIADPVWGTQFRIATEENNPQLARLPGQARGGLMNGPGTSTSDSILARLSTGEYVVNAASTAKHRALLENINADKFAWGGQVGRIAQPAGIAQAAGLPADLLIDVSNVASLGQALGQSTLKGIRDAQAKAAAKAAADAARAGGIPGAPGSIPANVSAYQAYAGQLMAQMGMQSLGSLISLWNGESGWNPNALNGSSGAYGIPQALPADKMASAGADWHSNAQTQIRWGLGYIRDRYGSPDAAWSFWQSQSPHWYGRGLAPTVFSRPTLIGVGEHGPETVSVSSGRYGGAGVVVAPGAITVYAARGQDERQIAAQAFTMLRAWVAEEERKAAKGGRA